MGYIPLRGFIHGPLNRDGDTLRVREVWDHLVKWSFYTFPFILPQHIMDTIHATPKPLLMDQDDLLAWNFSTNGMFSSNSAYTISFNSAVTHATHPWKWL